MKEHILDILNRIENKYLNDPTISDDKDLIVALFLQETDQSIKILNDLEENSLEWISSRFEELSYKLQSKEFVICVKNLLIKFPENAILKQDVNEAIQAYYGDE